MNSNKTINSVFKAIFKNFVAIFILVFLFFGISTPVLAQGKDTTGTATGAATGAGAITTTDSSSGGLLNFKACNFDEKTGGGSGGIKECLQQITIFLFIIGVFAAAFRFVMVALGNYLPNSSGNPEKEAREIISGLIWGLILIGIPGVILAIFNNSANNINFLFGSSSTTTPKTPTTGGTKAP